MSLRKKILDRFIEVHKEHGNVWIPKWKICAYGERLGYLQDTASRRVRELESGTTESGKDIGKKLEVKYVKGKRGQKIAYYRLLDEAVPPPPKKVRIVEVDGAAKAIYE